MSLIGEQCSRCVAAAQAEDGGGLAGSWWRGWQNVRQFEILASVAKLNVTWLDIQAGENSGYIGVGIVGALLLIVVSWYLGNWIFRRVRQSKSKSILGDRTAE